MIRLLDGPAAGSELSLRRAPYFLRVVIDRRSGKVDALDMLDDTPLPGEAVHVYQGQRDTLRMLPDDIIVCVRGPGGLQQAGGASGDYQHRADVDGEQLRDTAAWRAWVTDEVRRSEDREPVLPAGMEAGS